MQSSSSQLRGGLKPPVPSTSEQLIRCDSAWGRICDSFDRLQTKVEEHSAPHTKVGPSFCSEVVLPQDQQRVFMSGLELPVPLTVFSGQREQKWRKWHEGFEMALEACGVFEAPDKLRMLKAHLAGPAMSILKGCGPTATYDYVVSVLRSRFEGAQGDKSASFEFFGRTQRANETVLEYAYALSDLAEAAYGSEALRTLDAVLRDRFCAGVLPVYQGWLRTNPKECDTFEKAQMCAQIYENVLQSGFSSSPVPGISGVQEPMERTGSSAVNKVDLTTVCDISQKVSKLESSLKSLRSDFVCLIDQIQCNKGRISNKGRLQYQFTDTGSPICLYCKKPGHIRVDCRKRKNDDVYYSLQVSKGRSGVESNFTTSTTSSKSPAPPKTTISNDQLKAPSISNAQGSNAATENFASLFSQLHNMQQTINQMGYYGNFDVHNVNSCFSVPVLGKNSPEIQSPCQESPLPCQKDNLQSQTTVDIQEPKFEQDCMKSEMSAYLQGPPENCAISTERATTVPNSGSKTSQSASRRECESSSKQQLRVPSYTGLASQKASKTGLYVALVCLLFAVFTTSFVQGVTVPSPKPNSVRLVCPFMP